MKNDNPFKCKMEISKWKMTLENDKILDFTLPF